MVFFCDTHTCTLFWQSFFRWSFVGLIFLLYLFRNVHLTLAGQNFTDLFCIVPFVSASFYILYIKTFLDKQTTACPEQPGQSCLPEPGSHRCQAASLATMASGEAAGHLWTGCTDSQGADHSHSNVSQRAGTDPCTTSGSALFRCSDTRRSSHTHTPNWPIALFLLLLHPPGTLPADIWLCKNILTFKCHLKTYLFKLT